MKILETTKDNGFLVNKKTTHTPASKSYQFTVKDEKDQVMQGFGGAFTEASAYNLLRVNKDVRKDMLEAYFHPTKGAGYSMGRVSIHSCDFSVSSYDYVDPYDETLNSFNISRDQKIIDLILEAQEIAGHKISIVASPWSPPFWMKTNQSMIKGGELLPKYYDLWAAYIIKFIKAYAEKGITIEAITVQNEPLAAQRWESCIFDHEQEKQMVIHLGRAFKKANIDTKIYVWDHNRDVMYERTKHILSDSEAASYTYGVAFHWYDNKDFDEVKKTHKAFPDKHLLFTEGCQENGPHIGDYDVGMRYGINMMKDINNGTEGYIDWNLFLDTTGGPNHVSNLCSSPVIVDVFPEKKILNPSYYFISHVSKYVKPGAQRFVSETNGDVLHNVFLNPDGSRIILLLNTSENSVSVTCDQKDFAFETTLESKSFQTIII